MSRSTAGRRAAAVLGGFTLAAGTLLTAGCTSTPQTNFPSPRQATAAAAPVPDAPVAAPLPTIPVAGAAFPSSAAAGSSYSSFTCSPTAGPGTTTAGNPVPATGYLVGCDADKTKYLLGPAAISGTDVTKAAANASENNLGGSNAWEVDVTFNAQGKAQLAAETTTLYDNYQAKTGPSQLAITLDGQVYSAPSVDQGAITTGTASIAGSFTQAEAESLADLLTYGSLPIAFNRSQVASAAGAGSTSLMLVFEPPSAGQETSAEVNQAWSIVRQRIAAARIVGVTGKIGTDPASGSPVIDVTCPNAAEAEVTELFAPGVLQLRPVLASAQSAG
jgi:hypothetical protein